MKILLFFLLFFPGSIILAQEAQITVEGTVADTTGIPIPGVNVIEKGTSNGVITNFNGEFVIDVAPEAVLIFSSLIYENVEIEVNGQTQLNISMASSTSALDEVVVVGYGTQKKTSVTSAISSMDGEEVTKIPATNLSNTMAGRMSGVITRQGSGEPGADASNIFIRGVSTTGSSQPLVMVDGIPRSFQDLDPNTIETITVLKDAAAVAPFGVAGANGVILVTTKSGATGEPSLTYNGYVGVQNPTVLPEYVSSYQYATLRNAASINEGNPPRYPDYALQKYLDGSDPDAYPNSNAMEEMIAKNALLTSHNVSLSGGTERVKYYSSIGYMHQAGIWDPTFQNRYNLTLNLDAWATETTKISFGIKGRQQENNYPPVGTSRIFELIKYVLPTEPMRFTNGLNAHFPYGSVYGSGYSNGKTSEMFTQLSIEQELPFVPGLKAKGTIAYDPTVTTNKTWTTPVHIWSIDTTQTPYQYNDGIFGQDKPSLDESVVQTQRLTAQASLNYSNTFGKSSVGALALFESKSDNFQTLGASRVNYNLDIDELNMGSSTSVDISNSGFSTEGRQIGLVYRLTYDYDTKYLFETSGRYDGSYYFAPGHRFGFFPAFSAGWRLSEENFIKNNYDWIDNLKIRGSYGEVGALAGSPFQYLSTYNVYGPAYVFGGNAVQGIFERGEANPNITWERAKKSDVGFEASLWNGLFNLEADYFYEKRSNMLADPNVTVPEEYGIGLSQVNAGVMENQGIDLSIGSRYHVSDNLQLSLQGNFTYSKNTLLEVFETSTTFDNPNRRRTGRPLGSQFGYESLGFFQPSDFEEDGTLVEGIATQPWGDVQPGDIRYRDISGDGEISEEDLTFIGNPQIPGIIYGINPTINFKGFTVDLLFQGAGKTSFMGRDQYDWAFFNNSNVLVDNLDYWTPENTDAKYPRITNAPTPNNSQASSFWMRDASYLRLKSAMISYTIPPETIQKLRMQNASVFISGQNVLTWTKIRNYDPETVSPTGNGYPLQKVISVGLNFTF